MSVIINNEEYDINEGIRYLKTIYTTNYEELPEELKNKELKNNWDKYEGISKKLYLMSKSTEIEILELAKKILEEEKIEVDYKYHNSYMRSVDYKPLLKEIILFKPKNEWNN